MKTDLLLALGLAALASLPAAAAPLAQTAPVHPRPEAAAPVIRALEAGTEPEPAAGITAPEGWLAVTLAGPHEGYVRNSDITKALEVRAGATIHTRPADGAPVLATMVEGDPTEITGLRGRWTQVSLAKSLVGYIQLPTTSSASRPATQPATPPPATSPAGATAAPARPGPATPPPPAQTMPPTAPASPRESATSTPGGAAVPRLFQGKFASTRRPFTPRRPYDYELLDERGVRIAFLDVTRLPQTLQVEPLLEHTVVAYGALKAVPGTQDVVLVVESLQAR